MSNEWIFSKDTDATNVSNYYSEIEAENLEGVISGKAIYEGRFSVTDALKVLMEK